jgi:transposase InsO family protein
MASGYTLPPPSQLDIHDSNVAEKWKRFRLAWDNYSLATELNKKGENIQVATLLTIIGEDARDVYSTLNWDVEGDNAKIAPVLQKFAEYCQPRKNVPFERYRFNRRSQEPGETYDQYRTALRKLAEGCEFEAITPDEILRDRMVFGVRDDKVRERLLRESKLTLRKTDEICRAAESTVAQMKLVGNGVGEAVNAINPERKSAQNQRETSDRKAARSCGNCGRVHDPDSCPARGKTCNNCKKSNHFAAVCRGKKKRTSGFVRAVEESDTDETEELFVISDIAAVTLDDAQLVTLKLESGNYLRFQPDTGAQCNVIPVHLYKMASKDHTLKQVKKVKTAITAYGGSRLPVVGQVVIRVWRDQFKCLLDCKLVDCPDIRPILGRKACIGMNIIKYTDNDAINKPQSDDAPVYVVDDTESSNTVQASMSKESLVKGFPKVFADEVGQLDGEYHIKLDTTMAPVQHAPRRVPVALRARLKTELEKMEKQGIIASVTTPTAWVSSMVVVPKKNGKLRICLDPKDLNQAIQREHYPLPTIEDVATRLHGAKVFTKLDVKNGFWHVKLDEESSFLTTFNTPFGRYRWKRMPFGIRSAPEVFQRKMHELIEGMPHVEVVADDFVVVGYGSTLQKAHLDHDKNLAAFLKLCEQRGLKLNADKLKLRETQISFIGHLATNEGLRVDPAKVRAIEEMPPPTDKAGVQRLLGLAQYLSKFLPNLSDLTKPLRELTQQDVEWTWGETQATALNDLKKAVTCTPVLKYYNLDEEVTIQCDASQSGLGATLLQNGQPVAYASRALTSAETRYAQIEKELLAIVFACERFETYIYGRDLVTIETDHKPLETIVLKPLHSAPQRLQRMLLRLQKYSLQLKYKKGKDMFLADTLSRAYLPEINRCEFGQELEEIDHRIPLPVSDARWHQIKCASADDPVFQKLRSVIQHGWPKNRSNLDQCLYPFYDMRDELTIQEELIFKGQQLVVPASLRKELMVVIHASHIGIDACIRRARDSLYWPRMATELKEYISRCDVCLAHRSSPSKEPLLQHEVLARPWSKIGADLCELNGRTLLVMVDYYSNFVEVARITSTTSRSIVKELKATFARYGVPDILVTDNGPQFASAEFAVFAKAWGFDHVTSSPHHPQSNGKAENAVKTVKRLFKKCKESGQSEFLALLDWRNTPTEGVGTSPAQRLMGRRCKTLLPIAGTLLKPQSNPEEDARAIMGMKKRQQYYYDRNTKERQPIATGETVRMKLPGQERWSAGTCTQQVDSRSYMVKVGDNKYRRNRKQIVQSQEPPILEMPEAVEETNAPNHPRQATPATEVNNKKTPDSVPTHSPGLRRSARQHKTPAWQSDYVIT